MVSDTNQAYDNFKDIEQRLRNNAIKDTKSEILSLVLQEARQIFANTHKTLQHLVSLRVVLNCHEADSTHNSTSYSECLNPELKQLHSAYYRDFEGLCKLFNNLFIK